MITELTAEQESRFPEFVEKWTRIGLCTEPANRPAAEDGVRLAYCLAGLDPPRKIVWCTSPLSMGITRHLARKSTGSLKTLIREMVGQKTRSLVEDAVPESVWDSVRSLPLMIWESIGPTVRDAVLASVSKAVWDSVSNAVWASVVDSVRASVRDPVPDWVPDLEWVPDLDSVPVGVLMQDAIFSNTALGVFYEYFRIVCGLSEQTDQALGLMQVAKNAGWWLPHQDICWVSERPNRLKLDDRGRIHCEDGPALSYPDGWSIYAIRGVCVEEQVVMSPRSQDADAIRNEPNAEVKRIQIERFGWPEYLRAVQAIVMDTRNNDVEVTKEALMQTPDGQVVLVCACPSTSRVYCLELPPTTATCAEAQDWLSGGLSNRVINGA